MAKKNIQCRFAWTADTMTLLQWCSTPWMTGTPTGCLKCEINYFCFKCLLHRSLCISEDGNCPVAVNFRELLSYIAKKKEALNKHRWRISNSTTAFKCTCYLKVFFVPNNYQGRMVVSPYVGMTRKQDGGSNGCISNYTAITRLGAGVARF